MRISDWSSDVCSSDLNEIAVGDYRTFAKVSPPLRSEDDRQAILAGVADGTIDAIASDHSPHDVESKRLPFAIAEPGIVGLETLLPLSLQIVHAGKAGLLDLLARLTVRPAEILGLNRSEEHTSELQSLMRPPYALFC